MTSRRVRQSRREAARLPVLGALVLAGACAVVYLAFVANQGLPWSSTYDVVVEVPNAQRLAPHDPVRVGGVRVGQVSGIEARVDGRRPFARIHLSLDEGIARLPADTRARVSQASVLGASTVELLPGTSTDELPAGAVIPLDRAEKTVQLTDLLDIFDRATGESIQSATRQISGGLAARGPDINVTLRSAAGALRGLSRVSRAMASPEARLGAFISAYGQFAGALAPVRQALSGVFDGGAATLAAILSADDALGQAIDQAPQTERAVSGMFRTLHPTLVSLRRTVAILRDASPRLPAALGQADRTLAAAQPVLRQVPDTGPRLRTALAEIGRLAGRPSTSGSLRKGREFLAALGTSLDVLTPAQVQCNAITLWGENFSVGFGGLGFDDGPSMASVFLTHLGADSGAEQLQNGVPSSDVAINNLPRQNYEECESGNEIYTGDQLLDNPPGLQSNQTRRTRPPAGVTDRARDAGLLGEPAGP